jgi:Leucine-rich repeat (LRR) protein
MKKGSCACLLAIAIFLGSCINDKKKHSLFESNALEDISKIENISPEIQNIENENLDDFSYLFSDTSIKSLRLDGGSYSDLSPLAMLHDLEELSIDFNNNITDISPIGSLSRLKKLELDLLDSLTDISSIGSLVGLESLAIHNCPKIESIEAVSFLVNLKHLSIVYSYSDKYYKELVPLKHLEVLTIYNYVRERMDVSYIAQLYALKELEIKPPTYHSEDRLININQLGNLINLEKLSLSYLDGVDLSWITSLQKLKELSLRYCTINDISPLLELPNLERVGLQISKVKDIAPLLESKSIKIISGPIVENDIGFYDLFWERGIEYYPHTTDR